MKKILLLLLCIIFLISCSQKKEDNAESKINIQKFSNRVSLFNALEDQIELINNKDYIKANEKLEQVFLKSNQVGYAYSRSNKEANNYITKLNDMADSISNASTIQKKQKIGYDAKKSMLKLESGGSSNGKSTGNPKSESESSQANESEGQDDQASEDDIVLYEEKLIEEYPEAAMTNEDFHILDETIQLLDYVSKETMTLFTNNEKAIINREKYLFYALESLSRNKQYSKAITLIDEVLLNWQQLTAVISKMENSEITTIVSTIQNIENAITKKDYIAVKIQCDSAISELEEILTKPRED